MTTTNRGQAENPWDWMKGTLTNRKLARGIGKR